MHLYLVQTFIFFAVALREQSFLEHGLLFMFLSLFMFSTFMTVIKGERQLFIPVDHENFC